ncbi:MAG: hypothetical protein ACYDBJ_13845 [Aggregatilineales bacterium]
MLQTNAVAACNLSCVTAILRHSACNLKGGYPAQLGIWPAASNTPNAKASLISSDAGHGDYFYGLGGDERSGDGCKAAVRKLG